MPRSPSRRPCLSRVVALATVADVVKLQGENRRLVREVAERLGLDGQDQVRFATAVSEVARNAVRYARVLARIQRGARR